MSTRDVEQNWEMSIRRRRVVTAIACFAAALVAGSTAAVGAQDAPQARVTVVEVTGWLDRIQASFLTRAVARAERDGTRVLVVRVDSRRSVLDGDAERELHARLAAARVPVAVWVGPQRGARTLGGAAAVLAAADIHGVAPGARFAGRGADVVAPTLGDFIVALDGRVLDGRRVDIPTDVVRRPGRPPQRQLAADARVQFAEPPFVDQLLHAVTTPSAVFLLFTAGLLLLVFEFFTAGVGVAAATGALSLLASAHGLGALPVRPAGVALLLLGVAGFAVDVQAGAPRAWTAIGTVAFTAGTFFLFDGVRVPLPVIAIVLAGVALFMVAGMPAMIRTRFSTPTIGRDSMVGEEGRAVSDIAPEGLVLVRDASWPARTNRATPIPAGEAVRVAGIDGLLLEVEPLSGGARDYRR